MKDSDCTDDLTLLANTPEVESLRHNIEQAAEGMVLYLNANKTEFIYLKQE